MAKVVIFGQRDYAEQAHYYLTNDSPHEVVAFSVTADQCQADSVFGLPLVPFEEVQEKFSPGDFSFFLPMSGRFMNRYRKQFFLEAKEKGYGCVSYVSSKATINDNEIGENCFILENTDIQPFAKIGDNVVIWCSTHVGHHSVVGAHTWMGTNVVISGRCRIGERSYLASQSLIEMNVELGEGTLAGSACYIRKDTEPWGIYTGTPAKRRKISSRDFEVL